MREGRSSRTAEHNALFRALEARHPVGQRPARKRSLLADSDHIIRYAAIDFQDGDLDRVLEEAGFDPTARSLFLWEGVTNYLSAAAVDTTFRSCSRGGIGNHIVFTYVDRHVLDDPGSYYRAGRVLATSRRAGEALTFGIAPAALPAYLGERGFQLISDTGAADYRAAYYDVAPEQIRGHEFYRVAHAAAVRPYRATGAG